MDPAGDPRSGSGWEGGAQEVAVIVTRGSLPPLL